MKLWYRGKKVLIKEVLNLTHKEKIKETREVITPIVDTVKLCASKIQLRDQRGSAKIIQK